MKKERNISDTNSDSNSSENHRYDQNTSFQTEVNQRSHNCEVK